MLAGSPDRVLGSIAAVESRAGWQQRQSGTQQGGHESIGIAASSQAGRIEEQGIGLEKLGRIGVGEVVGCAEIEIGIVVDVGNGTTLFVEGMAGLVGLEGARNWIW